MSTHLPGFQSFLRFFASFYNGQISHQPHKEFKGWIKRVTIRDILAISSVTVDYDKACICKSFEEENMDRLLLTFPL